MSDVEGNSVSKIEPVPSCILGNTGKKFSENSLGGNMTDHDFQIKIGSLTDFLLNDYCLVMIPISHYIFQKRSTKSYEVVHSLSCSQLGDNEGAYYEWQIPFQTIVPYVYKIVEVKHPLILYYQLRQS